MTATLFSSPLVCLLCLKPQAKAVADGLTADVTFKLSGNTRIHMHPSACRHVWGTEEDFLNGSTGTLRRRIELAHQTRQDERERVRARRTTKFFTDAAKTDMENRFLAVDYCRWSMNNPPRMLTFKYNGSGVRSGIEGSTEVYWPDKAPDYATVKGHLNTFAHIWELGFGVAFDALRKLEFAAVGKNPHFHVLTTIPQDSFGADARTKFSPKSPYYEKFHGKVAWEFAELLWGYVTNQKPKFSDPFLKGRLVWMPQAHEVEPANSINDYIKRFIGYCRKDGRKIAHKWKQNIVAYQWPDQEIRFTGVLGFTKARQAFTELSFTCHTPAAATAALKYMAKVDGVVPVLRTITRPDGVAVVEDVSHLSAARLKYRAQGGRTRNPMTDQQKVVLSRLITYYNKFEDTVVPGRVNAPEPAPEPMEVPVELMSFGHPWVEAYAAEQEASFEDSLYREPFRWTSRAIMALRRQPIAWWERPWEVEAFHAAMDMQEA